MNDDYNLTAPKGLRIDVSAERYSDLLKSNERLEAERDRYRAALAGVLDAVGLYCQKYQLHGGGDIKTGREWDRMHRKLRIAREALGDE